MSNKLKILISTIAIVICLAFIVIVCVVLFKKDPDGGHIKIEDGIGTEVNKGELEVRLIRERLDTITLNDMGFPTPHVNTNEVDFSKSTANIFGIDSKLMVGPGCRFTAQMLIQNTKGYDFEYWIEIVPQNGKNLLAEQLELTVTIDGENVVKRTLDGGLVTQPLARVEKNAQHRFTAGLEYLSVSDNNQTQNVTLAFDMTIHARLI